MKVYTVVFIGEPMESSCFMPICQVDAVFSTYTAAKEYVQKQIKKQIKHGQDDILEKCAIELYGRFYEVKYDPKDYGDCLESCFKRITYCVSWNVINELV